MAKLSQINDAPSRLFGSVCLNSGALAIGATASALTTTATIGYAVAGLLYSKAAFTNQALVTGGEAFRVQPEQVTVYYVVALNAAGDVRVFQGRHLDEAYTDVSGLSVRGDAEAIYRRDFWDRLRCDELPFGLRFHVFDFAVNAGASTATKALQIAVGANPDGVIGPKTLAAIKAADPLRVIARVTGQRLHLMAGLPTWPAFGRGWSRRLAANLMEA